MVMDEGIPFVFHLSWCVQVDLTSRSFGLDSSQVG